LLFFFFYLDFTDYLLISPILSYDFTDYVLISPIMFFDPDSYRDTD